MTKAPSAESNASPASGPVAAGRAALLTSTAGLLVAAYLTYEHLTAAATLACPDTGAISCVKVTTSSYSHVLGVPVAVLGLAYFAAMTALCLPPAWNRPRPIVAQLRLALSGAGLLFIFYLIWVELFRLDAICLWCTAVHALGILLFAILAVGYALRDTTTPP
jgi:uncharacterized membrane protein